MCSIYPSTGGTRGHMTSPAMLLDEKHGKLPQNHMSQFIITTDTVTNSCGVVVTTLVYQAGRPLRPGFRPWSDLYLRS